VGFKNKHWHEKCFACSECKTNLIDRPFAHRDNGLYCAACYEKNPSICASCEKPFHLGRTCKVASRDGVFKDCPRLRRQLEDKKCGLGLAFDVLALASSHLQWMCSVQLVYGICRIYSLKHWNCVCLDNLAFDAQYKIVVLILLIQKRGYLPSPLTRAVYNAMWWFAMLTRPAISWVKKGGETKD